MRKCYKNAQQRRRRVAEYRPLLKQQSPLTDRRLSILELPPHTLRSEAKNSLALVVVETARNLLVGNCSLQRVYHPRDLKAAALVFYLPAPPHPPALLRISVLSTIEVLGSTSFTLNVLFVWFGVRYGLEYIIQQFLVL